MQKGLLFFLLLLLMGTRSLAQGNTIVSTKFPALINVPSSGVEAWIEVGSLVPGTKVEFVYKGISRLAVNKKEVLSSGNKFTTILSPTQFDDIGLEYYFELLAPSGTKTVSITGYTYINYSDNGIRLTDLKSGSSINDYQLISLPLTLLRNKINDIFEDDMGPYNATKWRIFDYQNGELVEYSDRFDSIRPGRGYWFITKTLKIPTTGEGATVAVQAGKPFQINLKKGWNVIGNPYNFNISWEQVKTFNNNPAGLGDLKVYESGFKDAEGGILPRLRGAYVFVERDMNVLIPVLRNDAINGRIAQEEKPRKESVWEVNFTLKGGEITHQAGGVGMHHEASLSKDRLDEITLPHFIHYLDMHVEHPEYFAPRFAKDVVPVAPEHTWEFSVESDLAAERVELSWERFVSDDVAKDKQWVLYDVEQQKAVSLLTTGTYAFSFRGTRQFRLYYGSPSYIDQQLQPERLELGVAQPNPFSESTLIPFTLPESTWEYEVQMGIFSMNGQPITTLAQGTFPAGLHEVTWDGTDAAGRRIASGLYICRMEVATGKDKKVFFRKILVR